MVVSQAEPFPFRSVDHFQYASFLCVPHTESDRRCGTEKVWLTRLVEVCEILAVPVLIQHTTFLSILLLHITSSRCDSMCIIISMSIISHCEIP